MTMKKCRHCATSPAIRPRGLCWKCYYTPGVKEQYRSMNEKTSMQHEPTMEEVEALVAEQMRNLPDWWEKKRKDAHYRETD